MESQEIWLQVPNSLRTIKGEIYLLNSYFHIFFTPVSSSLGLKTLFRSWGGQGYRELFWILQEFSVKLFEFWDITLQWPFGKKCLCMEPRSKIKTFFRMPSFAWWFLLLKKHDYRNYLQSVLYVHVFTSFRPWRREQKSPNKRWTF